MLRLLGVPGEGSGYRYGHKCDVDSPIIALAEVLQVLRERERREQSVIITHHVPAMCVWGGGMEGRVQCILMSNVCYRMMNDKSHAKLGN